VIVRAQVPRAVLVLIFPGQVKVGSSVSLTVTVNVQALVLPLASVAVQVTDVTPLLKLLPLAGTHFAVDALSGLFMAVAGAVIGGTSLMGGLGTIVGAFLGVLVLSLLNDGFTLLGVSAFTYFIILGAAILIAMILNVRLQLLREAGRQ